MRPIDRVLARLTRLPNRGGKGWKAICPLAVGGHQDKRDHVLKLTIDARGAVGLFCHNGCSTEDLLAAIGLRFSDLYPVRPGRGRRGPPQTEVVRLRRAGLSDDEIQQVLACAGVKARYPGARRE